MVELHQNRELTGEELTDLGDFVNTIVIHITDGNELEKEATSIMGGKVLETKSERLRREGREEGRDILADTIARIKNGERPEDIISSGVDSQTVEKAVDIVQLFTT